MKRLLLFICLSIQFYGFAQNGVNFKNITFEQALAIAKQENKLVFIDCYTSWCAPCKTMLEKVFTQGKAGDYFNPRFVCVKYDMEKGEGIKLAQRFEIHSYPTFLIVRPDGIVQHKLIGGSNLEEFIFRVEKGLSSETNLLSLQQIYEKGHADKTQLIAYHEALLDAGEKKKATEIFDILWNLLTDEEKMNPAYWAMYKDANCIIGSSAFDFLLQNLEKIRENVGQKKVDTFLMHAYQKSLNDYIMGYNNENTPSFALLKEQVPFLELEEQTKLDSLLNIAIIVMEQQTDQLATLIEKKMPSLSLEELKSYAFAYRGISLGNKGQVPKNYTKLGNELTQLVLTKMKNEINTVTLLDLENYLVIISSFKGSIDKEGFQYIVNLGNKLLDHDSTSKSAIVVKYYLERYKTQLKE